MISPTRLRATPSGLIMMSVDRGHGGVWIESQSPDDPWVDRPPIRHRHDHTPHPLEWTARRARPPPSATMQPRRGVHGRLGTGCWNMNVPRVVQICPPRFRHVRDLQVRSVDMVVWSRGVGTCRWVWWRALGSGVGPKCTGGRPFESTSDHHSPRRQPPRRSLDLTKQRLQPTQPPKHQSPVAQGPEGLRLCTGRHCNMHGSTRSRACMGWKWVRSRNNGWLRCLLRGSSAFARRLQAALSSCVPACPPPQAPQRG